MKLWLDDLRSPPDNTWSWCRSTYDAFVVIFRGTNTGNPVTEISFDHDLGDKDEGTVIAKYYEAQAYYGLTKRILWSVHSKNPVGRNNIIATMERADMYWDSQEKICKE